MKIVVFDLDETLGYFVEYGIFWDCLNKYLLKQKYELTQEDFNEILDLDVSFEEYCNRLIDYGWGWDTDELYFGKKVNEYSNKNRIIKLNRGWSNGIANDRIDRVNWNYDITRLKNQKYIDSHSLRPLTTYNNEVKHLIELL